VRAWEEARAAQGCSELTRGVAGQGGSVTKAFQGRRQWQAGGAPARALRRRGNDEVKLQIGQGGRGEACMRGIEGRLTGEGESVAAGGGEETRGGGNGERGKRRWLGFRGEGMVALKRGVEADKRGTPIARGHAGLASSLRRGVATPAAQSRGEQAREKGRWG
jgi:hypothetical protein